MNYNECKPIEGRVSTVWIVRFKDKIKLQIWHKDTKIEEIVSHTKMCFPGEEFTVGEIDIGEFNLDSSCPINYAYSSDGRKVNQYMKIICSLDEEEKDVE